MQMILECLHRELYFEAQMRIIMAKIEEKSVFKHFLRDEFKFQLFQTFSS